MKKRWELRTIEITAHKSADKNTIAELAHIIYNFYYQLRKVEFSTPVVPKVKERTVANG